MGHSGARSLCPRGGRNLMNTYRNSQGVELTTPCVIHAPGWELVPAEKQAEQEAEKKPARKRKSEKE